MSVYLCAAWQRQTEMRHWRAALSRHGVVVTSQWLDVRHVDASPEAQQAGALMDLRDLDAADVVIARTERPDAGYLTGGRHVEVGYALATGRRVHLVGAPENVFHYHPLVVRWPDFPALLAHLVLDHAERIGAVS